MSGIFFIKSEVTYFTFSAQEVEKKTKMENWNNAVILTHSMKKICPTKPTLDVFTWAGVRDMHPHIILKNPRRAEVLNFMPRVEKDSFG